MNPEVKFTPDFDSNVQQLDSLMRLEESFDLLGRIIMVGSKRAKLYFVNGMVNNESVSKTIEILLKVEKNQIDTVKDVNELIENYVAYIQTEKITDVQKLITSVLSGSIGLIIEGISEAIVIDARHFPQRSVDEPENDRVLRGPHEGFVEALVSNTALIRRRVRDTNLTISTTKIGNRSKTDVALVYLENRVNKKMLKAFREKLEKVEVNSLTMGQESLLECLCRKQKYNPFPRVRYTERPDAAAACIAEGSIIVLIDNSPAAMIVPSGILDFFQDSNDYYFMPFIGSYLRWLRVTVSVASVFVIPIWYILMKYPSYIPYWLDFVRIEDPVKLPVFAQLILIEFIVDALKLTSLNTPTSMGSTFSLISALVLGDFAVSARWFVPEVMLYMAFASLASFAQPSFELSFSLKLTRIFYLIMIALFGIWGFAAAIVISIIMVASTKTITGQSYLYPLIPFNWRAFSCLMFRRQIDNRNN